MRAFILILFAVRLADVAMGPSHAANSPVATAPLTSTFNPSAIEGTISLLDSNRNLVVLQERGRAKVLKFDSLPASLRFGERVSIAGKREIHFAAFPAYPDNPSGSVVLEAFETPADAQDHYLARLRGWLRPPADGNYSFRLAADDEAELWLGSDRDPATAKRIALVTSATGARQWDRDRQQRSQPVALQAGKEYYVEAIHREWRGHDHLAVAWSGPDIEHSVIGAEHLKPWRAEGDAKNGILREYWTNCFLTSLGVLSPNPSATPVIEVSEPGVTHLGAGSLGSPRRIRLEGPWPDERNFMWVEVDGIVSFVAVEDGHLVLELADRDSRAIDARMTVHVFNWGARPTRHLLNRRVRVQGVCEQTTNGKGEPTAGLLWAQDARQLSLLGVANQDWRDLQLMPMFDLVPENANLSGGQKILVRGTVMGRDTNSGVVLVCGDNSFYGFISDDSTNWSPVGPPVPVSMNDSILAGLAVASGLDDAGATFDHVTWSPGRRSGAGGATASIHEPGRSPALPFLEGSRSAPLGKPPDKGSVVISNAAVAIRAGGGNDWAAADEGLLVYQTLAGEGEIVARLTSFHSGRTSDKAGLMMRESRDADAPSVALIMTHGTRVDLQYRSTRGALSRRVDRLTGRTPQWFKLARQQHTLTARVLEGETLPFRKPIDLVGTLGWEQGQPVLLDAYERRLRKRAEPEEIVTTQTGAQEVLIADLPSEAAESQQFAGEKFRIRGVVTFSGRAFGRNLLFVQDESGGALIRVLRQFFDTQSAAPGQIIEAEGSVKFSPGDAPFGLSSATILGAGQLPRPLPFPDRQAARKADGQWVEASGIARSVQDGTLLVMQKDGLVPVWIGGLASSNVLAQYVDALVTFRGVFTLQLPSGPVLLVPSPRFVQVNEPAPADAFALPSLPIARIRARETGPQWQHRAKVTGVVTYRDGKLLCVQDASGGARIVAEAPGDLMTGDWVEVVGFPDRSDESLALVEARVRPSSSRSAPEPVAMPFDDLLAVQLDAMLVRIEGVVLDQKTRAGTQQLELQAGQRAFAAVLAAGAGDLPMLPVGSRVQVTGVNHLKFAARAAGQFTSRAATLDVMLRTPSDVVLLQRPPWWNWRHTAGVAAVLAAVLIGAIVWIRTLRRRVEERTRELKDTMGRLQRETEISATLAERDRLAAEIHDTLEQGLSGIMMQLDGVDSRLDSDRAAARSFLEKARRMVRFSRGEVRHSLWNLESALLQDGGLGAALAEIARQMSTGMNVGVEIAGEAQPLPPAVGHHLLRCAQESLNNALKHAAATDIRIKLSYEEDFVRLTVADNGRGFEPEFILAETGKSLGLRNLRSRSRKIRAQLDIASQPGRGTTIQMTVPLAGHTDKAGKTDS